MHICNIINTYNCIVIYIYYLCVLCVIIWDNKTAVRTWLYSSLSRNIYALECDNNNDSKMHF